MTKPAIVPTTKAHRSVMAKRPLSTVIPKTFIATIVPVVQIQDTNSINPKLA